MPHKCGRHDAHCDDESGTGRSKRPAARSLCLEASGDLVALLVFKTMVGLNKVPGRFDSYPPPPIPTGSCLTMARVPQPPLNPGVRDVERHNFWPGFVVVLIGLILAFCGARRLTGIETVDGGNARETQLIKAFAFDGLQFASKLEPPPPPPGDDPEAFEQWVRQNQNAEPPTWKVRVDTAAKTPCPT